MAIYYAGWMAFEVEKKNVSISKLKSGEKKKRCEWVQVYLKLCQWDGYEKT